MRIVSNSININLLNKYSNENKKVLSKNTESTFDKIEISSKAKDVQKTLKHLKSVPEVREDKIKLIKEQIESNNYRIDSYKIAKNMLDSRF